MRRELTWQAVVSAVVVSAVVSASYPSVLLKLGLGPNISVVSAFLGARMLLAPKTHGQNRWPSRSPRASSPARRCRADW